MIKYFVLALLLVSVFLGNAQAVETSTNETSVEDSDIGRLSYFLPQGKLFLSTAVGFNPSDKVKLKNNAGTTVLSSDTNSQAAALVFAYGIANNLAIGISGGYAFDKKSETTIPSTSSTTTTHRKGFSDPSFYILGRIVNSKGDGLFNDLGLTVKPSLIKNKIPNGTTDGSNSTGTTEVSLKDLFIISKTDWFEYQTNLSLNYQTSGDGTGATSALNEHYSSVFSVNFDHSLRFHLDPNIYIEPEVSIRFPYTLTTTSSSGTLTEKDDVPLLAIPGINFGYSLSKKIVASLGLAYSTFSEDVTITSNGASTSFAADVSSLGITLGIMAEL